MRQEGNVVEPSLDCSRITNKENNAKQVTEKKTTSAVFGSTFRMFSDSSLVKNCFATYPFPPSSGLQRHPDTDERTDQLPSGVL